MSNFWELVKGAIALNPQAFQAMATLRQAQTVALTVLLLAGLSQTIGQSIVLFVNRVKPLRFGISLLLATLLFVMAYGFWVGSTWLVSLVLLPQPVSYPLIYCTLGLAAAPQLFSFLIAMPYLGMPLQMGLSLWSFLAFVQGFNAVTGSGLWSAFTCGLLGWAVLLILQRTIGRPIARLGQWLTNVTAGTDLVTDLKDLEHLLERGFRSHISRQSGRH